MAENTRPYLSQALTLKTYPAQRAYTRHWEQFARAAFRLSVVLHQVTTPDKAAAVEEVLDNHTRDFIDRVKKEKARLEHVREDAGAALNPSYTNPLTVDVEISSPRAGRVVAALQHLDEMMIDLDALWLQEAISDGPYSQQQRQWEREFSRLTGRFRSATGNAINAARRNEQGEIDKHVSSQGDSSKKTESTSTENAQSSSEETPAPEAATA